MAKEKSININIKNTNVIKDKPKRKRRRRIKKQNLLNSDKKVLSNPYQYPMQTFITPPMNFNTNEEAKKYAKNYLLLKNDSEDANKNNLLLLEDKKEDSDKNNLIIPKDSTTNNKKQSKIIYKKNSISQRPINYTYKGLMSIKTIYELKRAMKLKDPSISDTVLDKINGVNKPEAIISFLSHINNTPSKTKTQNNEEKKEATLDKQNEPIITLPPSTIKKPKTNNKNENNIIYNKDELKQKKMKELRELYHNKFPKDHLKKKIIKDDLINLFLQKEEKSNYNTPVKQFDDENIIYDNSDNEINPNSNHLLESIKHINKKSEKKLHFKSPLNKYSKMIEPPEYDDDPTLNDLIKTGIEQFGYTPEKSRGISYFVKNNILNSEP